MKKLLLLFLMTFLITSCNNPREKITAVSDNEKLVRQYFEYFNNHQWKEMAAMYTETAEFKDPSFGPGIVKQTQKQTTEKYSQLNKIFPDLHDKIIEIYPSGVNHIIVEFVSTGTAADHSKFELPICTIFTIENGKITKDFTYFDNFEENDNEK